MAFQSGTGLEFPTAASVIEHSKELAQRLRGGARLKDPGFSIIVIGPVRRGASPRAGVPGRTAPRHFRWQDRVTVRSRTSVEETALNRKTRYFDAESFASNAIASCTVVMNWAGKMMVEFFSTEISAMVCRVRSCSATGCWVMISAAWPSFTAA